MFRIPISAILLQLWLALLAAAAPTTTQLYARGRDTAIQYGTSGGIIGLIVLILDIIIISKLFRFLQEAHPAHSCLKYKAR
jgi:hypothetical protein